MPKYDYPGVYVEDVPPLSRPIAGVSTSVAGFIGIGSTFSAWDKMPVNPLGRRFSTVNLGVKLDASALELTLGEWPDWANDRCYVALKTSPDAKVWVEKRESPTKITLKTDPKLSEKLPAANNTITGVVELVDGYYRQADANKPFQVTSWEQFKNLFGDFSNENELLAHAIYAFFNNGGTRCWVARLTGYDATVFQTCLDKFAAIEEISIVAAPGVATPAAVHETLVAHCFTLKNRIAILDCANDATAATIRSGSPASDPDGYSAFYCPWIIVSDPTKKQGETVSVPPSGAIAGIYARTDSERGVHKAPANEVVRGALRLAFEISKVQQGPLNEIGVNCIRNFYGSIKVWGARTLAAKPGGKPEWKYVNVRRFMNFLQESIEKELQWVVFEPNDFGLWQRITRTVSDFLLAQWRAGALFGETPKQAFFVRCDASTNPPDVRELGQVVTEIGIAVVKPAEFVIFRIQQQTGG